jgi:hypothetical protein
MVTALKPSDDRRAIIVRLFNAATDEQTTQLEWAGAKARSIRLTDTSEQAGKRVSDSITLLPHGLVALRVELK